MIRVLAQSLLFLRVLVWLTVCVWWGGRHKVKAVCSPPGSHCDQESLQLTGISLTLPLKCCH